jgi:hypothetical protein
MAHNYSKKYHDQQFILLDEDERADAFFYDELLEGM